MPPLPLAPIELHDGLLLLQLRAQWTVPSMARGESSWSFFMLKVDTPAQQALLWDGWESQCKAAWMDRRPSAWRLDQVIIEDRFPQEHLPLFIPINEFGTGGDPMVPAQVGPLISWRSPFPGRSYRGRTFWGPMLAEDVEDGILGGAINDTVSFFVSQMIAQFGWEGHDVVEPRFVIASRQHDLVPETTGKVAPVIHSAPVRILATNRRRLKWWDL